MDTVIRLFFIAFCLLSSALAVPMQAAAAPWVSAYYAGWFWDWIPNPAAAVAAVDMTTMTHFIFGRYAPGAGTLGGSAGQLLDGAGTGHTQVEDLLIAKAHANNAKALAMLGGAGDGPGWGASTANPSVRATLINNIVNKCVAKNYDGVDVDWEDGLDTATQQNQLIALLTELRAAAAQRSRYQAPNAPFLILFPGFYLNINYETVPPWKVTVASLVDQYNLMTYQMNINYGGWETWAFAALKGAGPTHPTSIESSIQGYVDAGVPRSKLGLGIGLYGGGYGPPVSGYRQTVAGQWGSLDYIDTWANFYAGGYGGTNLFSHPNGTYVWDTLAETGFYLYNPPIQYRSGSWASPVTVSVLSTEDLQSIAAKGAWTKAGNVGGAIVWTINYGYVNSTVGNPPMNAIKNAFLSPSSSSPCDIDSSGSTNVTDVQLAVNAAIGVITCTGTYDINKDSSCNVIDVQRVVNAALGGQCVSP